MKVVSFTLTTGLRKVMAVTLHFSFIRCKICGFSSLPTKSILQTVHLFISVSVTRLGDFLHFGQLFKALGNI